VSGHANRKDTGLNCITIVFLFVGIEGKALAVTIADFFREHGMRTMSLGRDAAPLFEGGKYGQAQPTRRCAHRTPGCPSGFPVLSSSASRLHRCDYHVSDSDLAGAAPSHAPPGASAKLTHLIYCICLRYLTIAVDAVLHTIGEI
jgi:hypothetical protein